MSRPFAVFDIDGTLIRWQMFHAIVDQLGHDGHLEAEDYAAIKTARMDWKSRRGEEAFRAYEAQLVGLFEKLLTKITVQDYESALDTVFTKYKDQVYRYTRGLIKELKEKDYMLFAISGSGHEIVAKIAEHYGFDDFIGSDYKREGSRFTGEMDVAVFRKPQALRALAERHGLTFEGSIGVGDSEGDIAMLDTVEHPIAFNPSKKLFRHASERGWAIVLERKNMVYELEPKQGEYRLAHTNA
jgi:HAD superfamily hydrolase (TIGR01490 family)